MTAPLPRTLRRGLAAVVPLATALACGSSDSASPSASDAGAAADGGSATVAPPPDCDPAADVKDAPACVVSSFGVFVDAASGSDTNPGTKDAPKKTLNAALAARGNKPRIYLCAGTYSENLALDASVSLYGGLACGSYAYDGSKPTLAGTGGKPALTIAGVASALVVSDLRVTAPDGSADATSSIAAFVRDSAAVTFRRVDLRAGKGHDGADGAQGANGALANAAPRANSLNGNDGNADTGGPAQVCTCVGGATSKGGAGGDKGADGVSGETAQVVPSPVTATGAGGTVMECSGTNRGGRPGSNAPPAAVGPGAARLGVVTDSGWAPAAGSAGTNGTPGQGGGGGAGVLLLRAGGGGGGACGGCGGAAGGEGAGGGASLALLSLDSKLTLAASSFSSADAGRGGAGATGGNGTAGGTKGARSGAACEGGNGGAGAAGGAGGGGAGGVSAAIAFKGTKPATGSDTTLASGKAGAAGTGPASNNGIPGQSALSLELE